MDPLNTIAGVIIGVALSAMFGAGVFRKAREEQEEATRVKIEQVEQELAQEHEAELQSRIAALEADYLKQSDALKASYQRESEEKQRELQGQLQTLEAKLKREKEEAIAKLRADYEAKGQESPQEAVSAPLSVERLTAETTSEGTTTELPPQVPPTSIPTLGNQVDAQIVKRLQGWGESKQLRYVAQMEQYCFSVSPEVREQVAIALKTLTTGQPVRREVKSAIAILGKLSTDSQSSVRLAAIQALGGIQSPQVIPYLQKALQDSSSEVIKTASAAIQRFKFYPSSAPVKVVKPAVKVTKAKVKT
ncbi:HEAT repeat domain-containing protein [Spirulina subsalsa FACHB-351]|uniref:HEAT repeat domain-containing protein n=1 Tax=Spirulina subsalsa FACHB-351 TaxID=234711 RepID=A0ABT3L579_9CYAN|nr:HEAT repeat domain-containing protein [Spirulina subsalsa]MCW6036145.1 HEAT repeat domain-containing protein [Spirulina subsalsa FACHB-351]